MPKSDLELPPPELAGYAPVALRIARFYERFPNGRIITRLMSRTRDEVIFRAAVYRAACDVHPAATGWAAEREGDGDVNTVACLENTETSAIGRALANLGFTASPYRPSREEMAKADRARSRPRRDGVPGAPDRHGKRDGDRDGAADLALLLRSAERSGLPARRAQVVRRAVDDPTLPRERLDQLARVLRRWLRDRVDRQIEAGVATVS